MTINTTGRFWGIFFAVFAFCALICAAPANGEGGALTLEECLAVAEANHPSIAGAEAQIAVSRGRLEQSAASDRLKVSGSASASRSFSAAGEGSRFSVGADAGIKLYDANRNKYSIESSRRSLSAAELDAGQTAFSVRAGVKSAFMTLLLSMETERQRSESVKAFERHLEQARGFYEAGAKPWYDVTKAEVDLGSAQMSLVEASANVRTAKASLANAMGLDPKEEFEIAASGLDILSIPRGAESGAESLALENRQDYRASELRIMAGLASLSAEARANSPVISLSGGYSHGGDEIYNLDRGWNTGLSLSVPIVDGGSAEAGVGIARAQIASLEASREKLRQDIALETRKAQSDIEKARERIRISELRLINAVENRRLAEGRYETGVGDPLEVTDALLSFTDARLADKQAHYDLQVAIISLESATGVEFSLLAP